jgi:hypothetical protein
VPAAQLVHDTAEAPEYWPTTHGALAGNPDVGQKEPAGQAVQPLDPVLA